MKIWTFDSPDANRTLECGAELGRSIGRDGLAIALIGPLAAGKTVFVKGLARGLGVDPRVVSSPTFVIAQQYTLSTDPDSGPESLHHVDLYRLESAIELETIGFYDMLAPGQVIAVEWADRFPDVLGREFLSIEFEGPSPEEEDAAREGIPWRGRRARVTAQGEDAERVLSDWAGRVEREARTSGQGVVSSPEMRVASILLLMLGLFVFGRLDFQLAEPGCEALVAVAADELGTIRARCVSADAGMDTGLEGIARLLDGSRIDLNSISSSLLQRLPGIGPVRAAAIVEARQEVEFTSIEDLERAAGIGPKTRMKIERWLFVSKTEGAIDSIAREDLNDGGR